LLEGLEIVEYNLLQLENEFTIGAEFYGQHYVDKVETIKISHVPFQKLKDITTQITDGDHGKTKYEESGVLYLLSESVKEGYIDLNVGTRYISEELNTELKRSELHPGDIVLTKTGVYFGKSAVIPIEIARANTSAHVAKITPVETVNSYFLSTFFNSAYGYSQLRRRGIKVSRPEIKLIEFQDILVSLPSNGFQSKIEETVIKGQEVLAKSNDTYTAAENYLLQILSLSEFQPSINPINVKKHSESLGLSGRLDAEYYQIKYEQIVEQIKSTNYNSLSDLVKIKKSIEPGSAHYTEEGLPFVRVSDYDKFGLSTPDKYLTDEFCNENAELIKKLKPKKETILFSKDGSVGTAYMLRKDADFITSGAILHLSVKDKTKIIPEYLTLALNSKLVQMQAERDAGGSIILHWRVSEIENVVVPVIDYDKQIEIAALVEESFKLKKQSEHLLEVAKTAVEIAIEQDEETALEYIKTNSN